MMSLLEAGGASLLKRSCSALTAGSPWSQLRLLQHQAGRRRVTAVRNAYREVKWEEEPSERNGKREASRKDDRPNRREGVQSRNKPERKHEGVRAGGRREQSTGNGRKQRNIEDAEAVLLHHGMAVDPEVAEWRRLQMGKQRQRSQNPNLRNDGRGRFSSPQSPNSRNPSSPSRRNFPVRDQPLQPRSDLGKPRNGRSPEPSKGLGSRGSSLPVRPVMSASWSAAEKGPSPPAIIYEPESVRPWSIGDIAAVKKAQREAEAVEKREAEARNQVMKQQARIAWEKAHAKTNEGEQKRDGSPIGGINELRVSPTDGAAQKQEQAVEGRNRVDSAGVLAGAEGGKVERLPSEEGAVQKKTEAAAGGTLLGRSLEELEALAMSYGEVRQHGVEFTITVVTHEKALDG